MYRSQRDTALINEMMKILSISESYALEIFTHIEENFDLDFSELTDDEWREAVIYAKDEMDIIAENQGGN